MITFNVIGELGADNDLNTEKFTISEAFPNPFNPSTSLNFNVNKEEMVKITIYDLLGNHVKNLVNDHYPIGSHSISWHARNDQGQPVSAEFIFIQFRQESFNPLRR